MVLDSTPLIHLSRVNFWTHLDALGYHLATTSLVMAELDVSQLTAQRAAIAALLERGRLAVHDVDALALIQDLSSADVSVVQLASSLKAVAVIDDRLARAYAASRHVKTVHSSLLLVDAVRKGVLKKDQAVSLLDEMVSGGWFCTVSAYQHILHAIRDAGSKWK